MDQIYDDELNNTQNNGLAREFEYNCKINAGPDYHGLDQSDVYQTIYQFCTEDGENILKYIYNDCLSSSILTILGVIHICIFIIGLVGNAIVCTVIATSKSMHSTTNCYLFNLSISDIFLLLTGTLQNLQQIYQPAYYPFGRIECFIQSWISETSVNVSALTISAFTIERYLAICRPFAARIMSQMSRVIKLICIIWLVSICFAIPSALKTDLFTMGATSSCTVDYEVAFYYTQVAKVITFFIPMLVIIVLHIIIGKNLIKAAKVKSKWDDLSKTNINRKTTIMLLIIASFFFVCWAPYRVYQFLPLNVKAFIGERNSIWIPYCFIERLTGPLYLSSTAINPIIFSITSNKFRNEFKKMVIRSWRTIRFQTI